MVPKYTGKTEITQGNHTENTGNFVFRDKWKRNLISKYPLKGKATCQTMFSIIHNVLVQNILNTHKVPRFSILQYWRKDKSLQGPYPWKYRAVKLYQEIWMHPDIFLLTLLLYGRDLPISYSFSHFLWWPWDPQITRALDAMPCTNPLVSLVVEVFDTTVLWFKMGIVLSLLFF